MGSRAGGAVVGGCGGRAVALAPDLDDKEAAGDGRVLDEIECAGDGGWPPPSLSSRRWSVFPGLGERDPASTDGRKLAVPSHRLRVLALLLLRRPAELLRSESGLIGTPSAFRQLSPLPAAVAMG